MPLLKLSNEECKIIKSKEETENFSQIDKELLMLNNKMDREKLIFFRFDYGMGVEKIKFKNLMEFFELDAISGWGGNPDETFIRFEMHDNLLLKYTTIEFDMRYDVEELGCFLHSKVAEAANNYIIREQLRYIRDRKGK